MPLADLHQRPGEELLGDEADLRLRTPAKVSRERPHLPGPDVVSRLFESSDRSPRSCAACSSFTALAA